jgi:5-methylcytosine-specific restriction endonuclease McrA
MTESLYKIVAKRADRRCEYCHAPEALFNHRFPVDHIIPQVFGGSDDPENLALACHACNGHKHQKQMGIDTIRKRLIRLFNPRQDKWGEAFHLESYQDSYHRTNGRWSYDDYGVAT